MMKRAWKMASFGLRKGEDLGRQNRAAHPTKKSEGYPVYVVEGFTGSAFPAMLYFQQVLIVE